MNAFNFATMTEYSGRNAGMVGNGKYPAFATFKQIGDLGYKVNKGAKGVKIFCGFRVVSRDKDGKPLDKERTAVKYATVFDIVDTNALEDPSCVEYLDHVIASGKIGPVSKTGAAGQPATA